MGPIRDILEQLIGKLSWPQNVKVHGDIDFNKMWENPKFKRTCVTGSALLVAYLLVKQGYHDYMEIANDVKELEYKTEILDNEVERVKYDLSRYKELKYAEQEVKLKKIAEKLKKYE